MYSSRINTCPSIRPDMDDQRMQQQQQQQQQQQYPDYRPPLPRIPPIRSHLSIPMTTTPSSSFSIPSVPIDQTVDTSCGFHKKSMSPNASLSPGISPDIIGSYHNAEQAVQLSQHQRQPLPSLMPFVQHPQPPPTYEAYEPAAMAFVQPPMPQYQSRYIDHRNEQQEPQHQHAHSQYPMAATNMALVMAPSISLNGHRALVPIKPMPKSPRFYNQEEISPAGPLDVPEHWQPRDALGCGSSDKKYRRIPVESLLNQTDTKHERSLDPFAAAVKCHGDDADAKPGFRDDRSVDDNYKSGSASTSNHSKSNTFEMKKRIRSRPLHAVSGMPSQETLDIVIRNNMANENQSSLSRAGVGGGASHSRHPGNHPSNRKRWTAELDNVLIEAVEKYGAKDWNFISSLFKDRNADNVRLRYKYYLQFPNHIHKKQFTEAEDRMILDEALNGNRQWSKIGKVTGRSCGAIKNRYFVLKRIASQLREEQEPNSGNPGPSKDPRNEDPEHN